MRTQCHKAEDAAHGLYKDQNLPQHKKASCSILDTRQRAEKQEAAWWKEDEEFERPSYLKTGSKPHLWSPKLQYRNSVAESENFRLNLPSNHLQVHIHFQTQVSDKDLKSKYLIFSCMQSGKTNLIRQDPSTVNRTSWILLRFPGAWVGGNFPWTFPSKQTSISAPPQLFLDSPFPRGTFQSMFWASMGGRNQHKLYPSTHTYLCQWKSRWDARQHFQHTVKERVLCLPLCN